MWNFTMSIFKCEVVTSILSLKGVGFEFPSTVASGASASEYVDCNFQLNSLMFFGR
jgi:hypothetical protein